MTEEKKEVKPEVKLIEVPTGSALAFQTPDGDILSQEGLLVYLANKIVNIEKAVA